MPSTQLPTQVDTHVQNDTLLRHVDPLQLLVRLEAGSKTIHAKLRRDPQ